MIWAPAPFHVGVVGADMPTLRKGRTAMTLRRTLLALVGATVLLAALASTGSARNLSTSNQALRGAFREVAFNTPFGTTDCQLTLEGSFHSRTTAKLVGSLVGYITSAILGPCRTATASLLRETLPWHIRYSGFNGGLPDITSITAHAVGAAFRIRGAEGITCLARSTATEPAIATFHRDTTTQAITEAGISGRLRTGPECFGASGTLSSNSGPITLLGANGTRIFISLI
jgi:hypothetical protein